MFFNCSYITNINLSNFNTQNITYMAGKFINFNCKSLKKEGVITNDKRILKRLSYDLNI